MIVGGGKPALPAGFRTHLELDLAEQVDPDPHEGPAGVVPRGDLISDRI